VVVTVSLSVQTVTVNRATEKVRKKFIINFRYYLFVVFDRVI